MKKILFPTDFSSIAENAYKYTLNLANTIKASITVLHVYELPNIKGSSLVKTIEGNYDTIEAQALDEFKKSIKRLKEISLEQGLTKVKINYKIIQGKVAPTILKTLELDNFDYLLMGTKGSSGLKEVFLGSNTLDILNSIDQLMISIPENSVFKKGRIKNILFTTSLTDNNEALAFRKVVDFAKEYDMHVDCVYIDDELSEGNIQEMPYTWPKKEITDYDKITYHFVGGKKKEQAINKYIYTKNIDLMVMISHKINIFERLFTHSLSEQIKDYFCVPILVVPKSTVEQDADINNI